VIQNICFSEELWPFPKESTLFLGEGALLPKELRPFPKENSLLLGEVFFFTKEFFLFNGEFAWDWHLIFFSLGKLFPKGN
jgi:hypothetical protein